MNPVDATNGQGAPTLIEAVAAGIAHEVRNPLNALQINLGILEQELREILPDTANHVFEVVATIANELHKLDAFVAEFLRYARPPTLRRESLPVRPLLADLVTFMGPECAKHGVALLLSGEAGSTTAVADGFQLKQALLNLILNALQATASGGNIMLETHGDGERLFISVRDTGEGISPERLERIFDVFFTTREQGTGLGLPIARRIVEQHGGELTISNEAPPQTDEVYGVRGS
jgi:signal transduction histidine kinase